ncbi:MAG: ABC transporter permease [Bacteroides sp.]
MIDLFQEIIATIRRNKLRTTLTGFAVAWGIFMLIVLLGAGNGLMNALLKQSEGLAMNAMEVWGGWTSKPYQGLKEGREIKLTKQVLQATTELNAEVERAGAIIEQSNVVMANGEDYVRIGLSGVEPIYLRLYPIYIKHGRFLNEPDQKERRKVVVLHEKTVEMLFSGKEEDAVGQYVRVSGLNYLVVGIYTDMGNFTPKAYIPYSTLQFIYNKADDLGSILFLTQGINDETAGEAFEKRYRKQVAAIRQFDADDPSAIWVSNRILQQAQQNTAQNALRTAIWVIGIFTLLSGIVGVSNIMLITVRERTHEFGIRKAIGAKPASILWLIIAESVAITTLFGYIGLVAGIGATEWMNAVSGAQVVDIGVAQATVFENPTVDLRIALQATLTLIIAGTLAGLFPARKAALTRPIEALREAK